MAALEHLAQYAQDLDVVLKVIPVYQRGAAMIQGANIIIRHNRAYLPTSGRISAGVTMIVEPIHEVPVKAREIVAALEKVIAAGTPRIPDPPDGNWKPLQNLLPRFVGVKSWKALAREGQQYAILWEGEKIRVIPSKLDKQGRFVDDYSKERCFPKDTPLLTIVETILEDARSRPELGLTGDERSD